MLTKLLSSAARAPSPVFLRLDLPAGSTGGVTAPLLP